MLSTPAKTTPDWDSPINQNMNTLEDKLQYKATCTFDPVNNVYVLGMLNIPATISNGLPQGLPDLFTVVARFPTDYNGDAKIRIGATDFTTKYAYFEAGDVQTVNFNLPEELCFFRVGGSRKSPLAAYAGSSFMERAFVG